MSLFILKNSSEKLAVLALTTIASSSVLGLFAPHVFANESEKDELISELVNDQNSLGQVTSVSQLSDVQPTDWAFQALQSLVERYGCIAGYPDGTFRGNRSATRYELAAALNACLDNISDKFATKEDLEAVKALQEEFQAELATLRGRVDGLEARTATLEAQQFSTSTKLSGEAIFAAGYTFDDNQATGAGPVPEPTEDRAFFTDRVRLTFDSSFSGQDRLRVRLQARNTPELETSTGTRMARLSFSGDSGNQFQLDELNYQFKPFDGALLKIDANAAEFQDNFDTISPYLSSDSSGALSRFARFNNGVYRPGGGGAGVTFSYDINDAINLGVGYLADQPQSSVSVVGNNPNPVPDNPRGGLFNGSYAAIAQVTVEPFKRGKFGLTYTKSFDEAGNIDVTGSTGSALARQPFGNGDDTEVDHLSFAASIQPADFLNISGWVGYAFANSKADAEDAELLTWAVSTQFPDVIGEGSLGYLLFGQPYKIIDSNNPALEEPGTSYHAEAGLKFAVNKNISVTPGVFWIINPEHNNANTDTVVGVVRATFRF